MTQDDVDRYCLDHAEAVRHPYHAGRLILACLAATVVLAAVVWWMK